MALLPPVAPIEIVIADIRSAKGHVRLELCDERTFMKVCALSSSVPARVGSLMVTLPAVPPGRYAVQVAHDENDNGKLDRTIIGIPREGIGFSRDARVCMGPPRFADAAFDHGTARQQITLRLRYHIC